MAVRDVASSTAITWRRGLRLCSYRRKEMISTYIDQVARIIDMGEYHNVASSRDGALIVPLVVGSYLHFPDGAGAYQSTGR